jgi:acetoacetyl-CoA synthetase
VSKLETESHVRNPQPVSHDQYPRKDKEVTLTQASKAVLTNSKDAICFSLAATALGAIFSSTAPDMGASGIIDRYSQLRPKVFICETEVIYAGKRRDLRQKFFNVAQQLKLLVPEFQTTVIAGGPVFQSDSV